MTTTTAICEVICKLSLPGSDYLRADLVWPYAGIAVPLMDRLDRGISEGTIDAR